MWKYSLVPSLSARQIFIAYSMKNRFHTVSDKNLTRGKAGYEASGSTRSRYELVLSVCYSLW